MLRILLVVDDYGELVFLQTLLKKIGFDVDGTQNPKKYEDLKLTLNPDLIVASSKGKNINGLKMAEELKRPQGMPKFILIVPNKMAQKVFGLQLKNVDGLIDSPIDAKKLLTTIAKICSLDGDALIDKYNKMISHLDPDHESDLQILKRSPQEKEAEISVGGGISSPELDADEILRFEALKESVLSDNERQSRMQEFLQNMETPSANGFSKDVVHRWNKKIRDEESKKDLRDLEDERQSFVKSLFLKKPSS